MIPYKALALVILIVAAVCYAPRLPARLNIWSNCRCGAQYCRGCGQKRSR